MDAKEFGKILRGIREDKKMNVTEFAKKVGYSQPFISMLENGNKGIPKPGTLARLADGLEVPQEYMLYLAGIIDEDIYKKHEQTKNLIASRQHLIAFNERKAHILKKQIEDIIKTIEDNQQSNTGIVNNKQKQKLLEEMEAKHNELKRMYEISISQRDKLAKENYDEKNKLEKINQLIKVKESTLNEHDKIQIQENIDEVTSDILIEVKNTLNITKEWEDVTHDIKDKVISLEKILKDKSVLQIQYGKYALSSEDKEKIIKFIETFIIE